MKFFLSQLLTGFFLFPACSIREDRSSCPCRLELDLQAFAAFSPNVTVVIWEGPSAGRDTPGTDKPFIRELSKGFFDASVWTGAKSGSLTGSRLELPMEVPPDSLRLHRIRLDCRGETCRIRANPFRQYARITLNVVMKAGETYPCRIRVESDYQGLDLRDLHPIPGRHAFSVNSQEEGHFIFDLLRHGTDTNIRLEVWKEEALIASLPFAEWLRAVGYDWEALDLIPVNLSLDYEHRTIRVSIAGWEEGNVIETLL